VTVQLIRHRFTVEEYDRMAQSGVLSEDDRVELIDGEIVEMSPIGSRHAACVKRLNRLFSQGVGQRAVVSVQDPIHLGRHSEPQPDIILLRPHPDFYAADHPSPADALLVVEVAEASSEYDREVKVPLYARAGIPEVWVVDLGRRTVEVYRTPSPQGYTGVQRVWADQSLSPMEFPDLIVAVDDILG